jgi:hypothetical protein
VVEKGKAKCGSVISLYAWIYIGDRIYRIGYIGDRIYKIKNRKTSGGHLVKTASLSCTLNIQSSA